MGKISNLEFLERKRGGGNKGDWKAIFHHFFITKAYIVSNFFCLSLPPGLKKKS